MNILVLTRYGHQGASSRLRSMQFFPYFIQSGYFITHSQLIDDQQLFARYNKGGYSWKEVASSYWQRIKILLKRKNFDLIWIEKELFPFMPVGFCKFLLNGTKYIVDYDDAIFHNYDLHPSRLVRSLLGKKIDNLMAASTLVVAGNEYIASRARVAGATKVEIVPTVIDLARYSPRQWLEDTSSELIVVWIGSPSTVKYLALLEQSLAGLSLRHNFRLRVIGGGPVNLLGTKVEILPWSENTEVSLINECDIGIMPLTDSPWERGKCGYKLIQYMACGLPVVGSAVGVNQQIIDNFENGFLVTTPDDWFNSLDKLLTDFSLRKSLGRNGRLKVERQYCVQQVAPLLTALMNNCCAADKL